jgi:hypothetical protein
MHVPSTMPSPKTVLPHQPRDALARHDVTTRPQLCVNARTAVPTTARLERGADVRRKQVVTRRLLRRFPCRPCVVPGRGNAQHAAHEHHGVDADLRGDGGVPHDWL